MKRKLSTPERHSTEPPGLARGHGRRQPQVSCDFCRLKKLKCDRARPCSSCVARRQSCNGILPTASASSTSTTPHHLTDHTSGNDTSQILQRLERLERAVFAGSRTELPESSSSALQQPLKGWNGDDDPTEFQHPYVIENSLESKYMNRFTFRIAKHSSFSSLHDAADQEEPQPPPTCISLPTKDDMLVLLDDYIAGQHVFIGVVHPPTMRALIHDLCARLHRNAGVDLASVALVLIICATSTFYWDPKNTRIVSLFKSEAQATKRSLAWQNDAWDLLDHAQRAPSQVGTLEGIQASVILSDLIYQMEGCSPRFHRLQSSIVTSARELSLHLIDVPSSLHDSPDDETKDDETKDDDEIAKEIKRRMWWHIASTDWLLSTMSGPLYRTYIINPHHMNVRYPRDISINDVNPITTRTTASPDAIIPSMTTAYPTLRIHLAEICRTITDTLPPLSSPAARARSTTCPTSPSSPSTSSSSTAWPTSHRHRRHRRGPSIRATCHQPRLR
ncbi:hypothetical protein B0T17DRAFT_129516 [Bombardia bombarda]|uniref:Zn(2)-C6 fungal-type domain-containing protein n=1 Tax=Bombardia bombarda TaxID=252184 RepID=A0AA39U196_9PEZI|nr:hypothetical protein B0T17DRAFT_129516 [Bombardia bombarda]